MVRQQELARRELAAMTGETRISAWVLGMTPIAIAVYIMIMNPNYLNMLLEDAAGQTMMITALVLQGLGGFILWRMLRSV
jgi:tight adherence protein B